jgi:hypothetical protein
MPGAIARNLWDGLVLSLCYVAGCAIATPDLRIEPLRALVTRACDRVDAGGTDGAG